MIYLGFPFKNNNNYNSNENEKINNIIVRK